METYTIDYFIEKLDKIEEKEWGQGNLANHCLAWHLGMRFGQYGLPKEMLAFSKLLGIKIESPTSYDRYKVYTAVYHLNDNTGNKKFKGNTPKERTLNELNRLKFPPPLLLSKWQRFCKLFSV